MNIENHKHDLLTIDRKTVLARENVARLKAQKAQRESAPPDSQAIATPADTAPIPVLSILDL